MTAARSGPAFSVHDIPFSTYGSWFDISPVIAEKTYAEDLHLVSHQNGMHGVLRLVPLNPATGDRAETRVEATPGLLSWIGESGRVDLAYESPDTVRLRGSGLGLGVLAAAQALAQTTTELSESERTDVADSDACLEVRLEDLVLVRQASTPELLRDFGRWQDVRWRRGTLALR